MITGRRARAPVMRSSMVSSVIEQARQRGRDRHVAGLHQRESVLFDQHRPEPQPAQRDERRIADAPQRDDSPGVWQLQQCEHAAQRAAQRFAGAGAARRLAHQREDRQPRQHRHRAEHDEGRAPRGGFDQPRQRRAGQQHADRAQRHRGAGHRGEALRRKAPRDEYRAGDEGRRAADPDQRLAEQQQPEVGSRRRQRGADHRQRKRGQHGAAQSAQVDADPHCELQRAEREVEGAGEEPQRLLGQREFLLQRRRHDRGGRPVRLAQRKGRDQCDEHRPWTAFAGRGSGCRSRLRIWGRIHRFVECCLGRKLRMLRRRFLDRPSYRARSGLLKTLDARKLVPGLDGT
ncbi:MAG TPA: hypothetical protein PLD19_11125 [Luteimonas sp.]|nr:hypothetical protein [Luteimonas sp.]